MPGPRRINIEGQRFNRWLVLRYSHSHRGTAHWMCRCDCGSEVVVTSDSLRRGRSQSCGCYMREATARQAKRLFTKHGHTANYKTSLEYWVWAGMIARCTNPKHTSYKNYGGRGITVCKRWLRSFSAFIEDMGPKPTPQHTIDRKNNDGNYTKRNCRWATRSQQNLNRRK